MGWNFALKSGCFCYFITFTVFENHPKCLIVLDSTNKTASIKFPLVIWGVLKIPWKNSSNRNATGYKWVLVTCWASTNTHLYHVALRFDEFFHGIFKTPQITNVNLIVAVLLVESNTMKLLDGSRVVTNPLVTSEDYTNETFWTLKNTHCIRFD